jgi:AbrB family looped-hinge helix DNA binding protein
LTDEYKPRKVRQRMIREAAVVEYSVGREEAPSVSTISSKNQITLPAHLLRELGLHPGDRLAVSREGARLVLRPRPQDWVSYHGGGLAGLYGETPAEIEAYVRDLRTDTGREEEIERAWSGKRPAAEE